MRDGWIRVAAGSIGVTVADPDQNAALIRERIDEADAAGVNLLVLPELCLSAYSCGDLFYADQLLEGCQRQLTALAAYTAGKYPICVLGLPLSYGGKLYNCAAVIGGGHVLGLVPKLYLPGYGEFYEKRQFTSGARLPEGALCRLPNGDEVPFGLGLRFAHAERADFVFAVEICEDLWAPCPPSTDLCRQGAVVIANLSASDELIGKADYRRQLVSGTSGRLLCGYVYAGAGPEESTQDMVCGRHHVIAENGVILAENPPFGDASLTYTELDLPRLCEERRRNTSFLPLSGGRVIEFSQEMRQTPLSRAIPPHPFVPSAESDLKNRAETILTIQSYGLKKRLAHTHAATAVIGVSGGLDSTLALLVAARAMDLLGRPRRDILAVTMPCFGTTSRTRHNAELLCAELGATLRTVDITAAVKQHFADIGQDPTVYDVTFENSQARERTQVLMDLANQSGGLVIGTGDLSELALGWATYNGDHMSMYAVNASVPKTLVRYLVAHEAKKAGGALQTVLEDVLDTPVSPELLPVDAAGDMTQKTEELVGPYELHGFFLYYMLRFGTPPRKIERMACRAFAGRYTPEQIRFWLRTFIRRFFSQQFKRSCLPDGPKVGSVTLSPRSDWRMPSDAAARLWLSELEE